MGDSRASGHSLIPAPKLPPPTHTNSHPPGPRSAPRFIKREEIAELMVDLKDSWVALLPRAVFGGALLATYKANGPLPAHIPMVELDIRSTRWASG